MQKVATIGEVRAMIQKWKKQGEHVGLVPTMGYLHEGHASLIRRARAENERVVVSIFVNPTQFAPTEDLATYPRDLEKDSQCCAEAGADLIFHPEVSEMYPDGFCTSVTVDGLSAGLCGRSRPIHFKGVCTVVNKLLHIVRPDRAYFGQKDAQQLAIIRRMVDDLNIATSIIGCPIVREADGLALSSRNAYLSADERRAALVLYRAVCAGEALVRGGEKKISVLIDAMRTVLSQEALARVDYVEAVNARNMQPMEIVARPLLLALAVFIGKTRLIDNCIVE